MPFFKTTDGTDIFYNDWGSGRPVILLHGWPLDADMWEYQAPAIAAAGYRVIAYDRRGFGRSGQPWSGYDYDTLADDLKVLIETLNLRDAILVGFSMGGGEVARYLGRHGGARVGRAVFIASVTPFMLRGPDNAEGVPGATFDEMADGLRDDRPNFLSGFGKTFFGAGLLNFKVSAELLRWASQVAMLASPKATMDCMRAFAETDFRADLARITVPTLVIHGDADATVPIDAAGRRTAAMIPGATLLEYAGAPHGLFFTEKERLNRDLLAFFRG